LPYDAGKAIAAWELALQRELPDAAAAFAEMVAASRERSDLMSELARLSQTNPAFRVRYLEALEGAALQAELEAELRRDPQLADFSPAQRTRILEVWILEGDLAAAEAFFQAQADTLPRAWWLRARVAKEKADFRQAVLLARAGLDKPELPETTIEDVQMVRVEREFKVDSTDVNKGAYLLRNYLEQEDFPRALAVCEALLADPQAPREFHYWRAECLFHLQDYIECWFSLEAYVDGEY
jgi:hypothetical protein